MTEHRDPQEQKRHEHALEQHALQEHEVQSVLRFFQEYGRAIVFSISTVVIVILIAFFVQNRNAAKEVQASQMLMRAFTPEGFEQILNDYTSTAAAPAALLATARTAYNQGDYEKAAAAYQRFLTEFGRHEAAWIAEFGQAACLEAQQETEAALAEYRKLAKQPDGHLVLPIALTGQIRCLEQLGRTTEAIQACEELILTAPQSGFVQEAESVKARMERKTGK